jgi:hypothetical protein
MNVTDEVALPLAVNAGLPTLCSSPGADVVAVGDGQSAVVGHRGSDGGWTFEPLEVPPEPVETVAEEPKQAGPLRVRHTTFGTGLVVSESGTGDSRKLVVEFSSVGTKTLLARFVEPLASGD